MKWRGLGSWRPSRIGLRLLAFNLLVVFVPVTGVFYLDVYETKLLQAQEREMVQQARVLAAVLGGAEGLDAEGLTGTFARLERRGEARLRVFDAGGALIADSDRVQADTSSAVPNLYPVEPVGPLSTRKRILYRLGARMANARDAVSSRLRSLLTRPPAAGPTDHGPGTLDDVLREALADTIRQAHGIAVSIRGDDTAWLVRGSRERLTQAIENLLSNACELTSAGNNDRCGLRGDRQWMPVDDCGSRSWHPRRPHRTSVRPVLLVSPGRRSPRAPGARACDCEAGHRGVRRCNSGQKPGWRWCGVRGRSSRGLNLRNLLIPPSLKLRRTTVALAEVVRPRVGGP
jgi:hypothetical protein